MNDQIQEGVFFRPGEKPPDHFAIAFLKSKPGATPAQIDQVLTKLFLVYRELKQGRLRISLSFSLTSAIRFQR